jgi:hypothetical protein
MAKNLPRGEVALLLGIALIAIGGMAWRSAATSSPESPRDSVGWMTCREWRQLIADADILTTAEFRSRLQAIEGRARYATTDGLAEAVRRTLQASTKDDVTAAQGDIHFVTRTCSAPELR